MKIFSNLTGAMLVVLLTAFFVASGLQAAETEGGIPWKTTEYTLLAREMPLRDALDSFGTAQGIPVVSSRNVGGTLSGDFRKLPPREFLERVAAMNSLVWYYDGTILYVYASGEVVTELLELQYMKVDDVAAMLKELGIEDHRFPLKNAANSQLLMVSGPPRYVELVQEVVKKADALQMHRAHAEIETRIFPLVHTWADNVSLGAQGAESVASITGMADLLKEILKNAKVRTRDGAAPANDQESVAQLLAEDMESQFEPIIRAENRLNAIIVRDASSRMPLYEELIRQLDVPQQLVEIAVTVVELNKDDALDWQLSVAVNGSNGNLQGAAGAQNAGNLFAPGDLFGKGLTGALTYLGKHVSVSASLSALREKGKARSISRTSILTMNNLAASMTDMQSYHAKVVGTEVATLQEVSAGTTLKVTPRIVKARNKKELNQLWMTISLDDGGFEGIAVDSIPVTRSSTVQTQAAVFEGDSIMLAGYLRDTEEKAGWGIPYLRDIPYIGWLFGGISLKTKSIQRMFILTPFIIDLDAAALVRTQAERARDITLEETLEDDRDADDRAREIRKMERDYQNKERDKFLKEELKIRKGELELREDKADVRREEIFEARQENLEARREAWEARQRQKKLDAKEAEKKAAEAKADAAVQAEVDAERQAREVLEASAVQNAQ